MIWIFFRWQPITILRCVAFPANKRKQWNANTQTQTHYCTKHVVLGPTKHVITDCSQWWLVTATWHTFYIFCIQSPITSDRWRPLATADSMKRNLCHTRCRDRLLSHSSIPRAVSRSKSVSHQHYVSYYQ
jgi:hypothetical protein